MRFLIMDAIVATIGAYFKCFKCHEIIAKEIELLHRRADLEIRHMSLQKLVLLRVSSQLRPTPHRAPLIFVYPPQGHLQSFPDKIRHFSNLQTFQARRESP
ncbi:uncharacterized protein CLUP02_08888 [Colletotrichum lupini]|uniref:Uncharacterized protein n=1 Tax=Colletotrichum lupini TaxID=145971 RepID=A0A9Q8WH21_9PEZI|nr:uncharacterized protein CLUP02_08888 [Colletotrichum lupini]UQC83393.1 hypothetical protein CLUP02_08888 [Colletotrichum lupini]